jgi:hypothetical protein
MHTINSAPRLAYRKPHNLDNIGITNKGTKKKLVQDPTQTCMKYKDLKKLDQSFISSPE